MKAQNTPINKSTEYTEISRSNLSQIMTKEINWFLGTP